MRYNWLALALVLASPISGEIPPHTAVSLTGIHGYADWSVEAGSAIQFHVSSSKAYELEVFRLGDDIDGPYRDQLMENLGSAGPSPQPIHPGSYIYADESLAQADLAHGFTLECWVRQWRNDAYQGLITQGDLGATSGFGISLTPGGGIDFAIGGSSEATPSAVQLRHWQHVVVTWNGQAKEVWVNGQSIARWPYAGKVTVSAAALRLGAAGRKGMSAFFLDGDLAMPVVYGHALSSEEISARFSDQGLHPATGSSVLACWPLSEETGNIVADISRFRRTGRIINKGTWGIGGPSFEPAIPRFSHYDPARDSQRGHGLRLASDDLYDCRWPVVHEYRVPSIAMPGIYVARFRYDYNGPCLYHITFVVTRNPARRKKAILVLASTNTWRAYNTNPFPKPMPGVTKYPISAQVSQRWAPAYSLYRRHAAGQGVYQVGLRIPWPSAGPYVTYGEDPEYSHLCRAERPLHIWLEANGYEYDLATELQLHRDPDLLDGYKAVVINGHSEYWSAPMYRAIEQYLARGGNLAVLSGNTAFWRVSFDEDFSSMECRKVDAPGAQIDPELRGERWHSQDGTIGGLMREAGLGEERITGMITLGWTNGSIGQSGPYRVVEASPMFSTREATAIQEGDYFGDGANGHEFDALPSVVAGIQIESAPANAPPLPRDASGIVLLARGTTRHSELGGTAIDWYGRMVPLQDSFGGDIIWWDRPEGGHVFTIGSIGASAALARDERLQELWVNALARFGVTKTYTDRSALSAEQARRDFTGDGMLDIADFFALADGYGKQQGEDRYNSIFDLNGNSRIEMDDVFLFVDVFGR